MRAILHQGECLRGGKQCAATPRSAAQCCAVRLCAGGSKGACPPEQLPTLPTRRHRRGSPHYFALQPSERGIITLEKVNATRKNADGETSCDRTACNRTVNPESMPCHFARRNDPSGRGISALEKVTLKATAANAARIHDRGGTTAPVCRLFMFLVSEWGPTNGRCIAILPNYDSCGRIATVIGLRASTTAAEPPRRCDFRSVLLFSYKGPSKPVVCRM